MITRDPCRCCGLIGLMLLAVTGGCAKTNSARLKTWRAAQLDVVGIERLAVMGFQAPTDVALILDQAAVEQLRHSRFYQVLHAPRQAAAGEEIPLPTDPDGLHQIVCHGRRLGADAVLVGRAQRDMDLGAQLGNITLRVGDPKLAVTIRYYVVDMRTGKIRGQGKIARRMTEQEFARDGGLTEQTADNFIRKCVKVMVSEVTAGSGMAQVELARVWIGKGSSYIDEGNDLAASGNWPEAAKHYRAALQVNPDSHQALHNLGLAAEAQGRFDDAKEMYRQAIEKADQSLYRQALSRVSRTSASYQLACRQILGRPRHRPMQGRWHGAQQLAQASNRGHADAASVPDPMAPRNNPQPATPPRPQPYRANVR